MAPWIKEIQTLVQDNTIQALYWYNLLMVNYTAHNPCIVSGGEKNTRHGCSNDKHSYLLRHTWQVNN